MVKPQSPCKDCDRHEFGCRYGCEQDKEYHRLLDEWNRMIKEARERDRDPRPAKRTRKR